MLLKLFLIIMSLIVTETTLFAAEVKNDLARQEGSRVVITYDLEAEDAEAFFVSAMDADGKKDFLDVFQSNNPMGFSGFFKKYSEIADYCEDAIIAYEVVTE